MIVSTFYNQMLRKYVIVFGTLFNDISIQRKNTDDSVEHTYKVPISYGPKEKFLARIRSQPNLEKHTAITLPRMGFFLSDVQYDAQRARNPLNRVVDSTYTNKIYHPVPYKLTFELSILSNNTEDGLKIVEQILPFFTPNWSVTVKPLEDFTDHKVDVSLSLEGVTPEDDYDQQFTQRRAVTWTLNFVMDVWIYQNKRDAKIIKKAFVNFFENETDNADQYLSKITTYPGMDSEGVATTDPDEAVDPLTVEKDDDWDFVIEIDSTG